MEKYIIGLTFQKKACRPSPDKGRNFFSYIGLITPDSAQSLFGVKPEKVTTVTCTVTEQDTNINKRLRQKNNIGTEYYGMYEIDTGDIHLIQPSAMMFNMQFPAGADIACTDNKGNQIRSIVKLEIKE